MTALAIQTEEQQEISFERKPMPLVERYRPKRLADLLGQNNARKALQRFTFNPYSCAMLFEGDTGTGKTSAALALAAELGCVVEQCEFGGLWQVASGEQSADAVRAVCEHMWQTPMLGSGWRVFVINEADRMSTQAETIWLDRLENLPNKTVVIFTTNHPDKLTQRFTDRCLGFHFESQATALAEPIQWMLSSIWADETGQVPDPQLISDIAERAAKGTRTSFRRALQLLQTELP